MPKNNKDIKELKKEYDDLYSIMGDMLSTHKKRLDKIAEMIVALSKLIKK